MYLPVNWAQTKPPVLGLLAQTKPPVSVIDQGPRGPGSGSLVCWDEHRALSAAAPSFDHCLWPPRHLTTPLTLHPAPSPRRCRPQWRQHHRITLRWSPCCSPPPCAPLAPCVWLPRCCTHHPPGCCAGQRAGNNLDATTAVGSATATASTKRTPDFLRRPARAELLLVETDVMRLHCCPPQHLPLPLCRLSRRCWPQQLRLRRPARQQPRSFEDFSSFKEKEISFFSLFEE